MAAAKTGKTNICDLLLDRRLDAETKNCGRLTALGMAKKNAEFNTENGKIMKMYLIAEAVYESHHIRVRVRVTSSGRSRNSQRAIGSTYVKLR